MALFRSSRDSGLILYHFDTSTWATKVRLALAVKGLTYQKKTVLLPAGECWEPWFMRLNPAGLIPVLVHDGRVITESARIIDYLDTVFHDRGPRLVPPEDTDLGRRVRHFRDLLDNLPVRLYTFGSMYHPDLAKDPEIPEVLRRKIGRKLPESIPWLQNLAAENPDLAEAYTIKINQIKQMNRDFADRGLIVKLLDDLEETLDEVEKELGEREKEKQASGQQQWLCGESFTAADIMLSVFLHRLNFMGLAHRSMQERPLVTAYYLQAKDFAPFKSEVSYITNMPYVFLRNLTVYVYRKKFPQVIVLLAILVAAAAVASIMFQS